ncbi:MAG: dTMP kinase [Nitrospirae bacterium]|nr:dTMP kinase [Nitrospirota bacterium]
MVTKAGTFIVFEGLDGSGKTTQAKLLAGTLRRLGIDVIETEEPTRGSIGILIREILSGRAECDDRALAALFAADRVDHLHSASRGIYKPAMAGRTIVSDRYYFSSYAYNSAHLPIEYVIGINSICAELMRPDVNVFLDLSPEKCLNRLKENRKRLDTYENVGYLRKVRFRYFEAFKLTEEKERVAIVDADSPALEVSDRVAKIVLQYCNFTSV